MYICRYYIEVRFFYVKAHNNYITNVHNQGTYCHCQNRL